jgi:hypothetical protein
MTRSVRLAPFFLIAIGAVAQHSGGFAAGAGHVAAAAGARAGSMHTTGPTVVRGANGGYYRSGPVFRSSFGPYRGRGGFGYGPGYGWPYFPIWSYDFTAPLPYSDDYAEEYPLSGNLIVPPAPGTAPAPPPQPAVSVIREYDFGKEAAGLSGEPATFTIVLKDGSTRQATASWVAGGKLHYVDLQARQPVLAPEVIDHSATERANKTKNLRMDLPPG